MKKKHKILPLILSHSNSGVHEKRISGVQFHPYYRCFFLHHADGTLTAMSWGGKKDFFFHIEWFSTVNISDLELRGRFAEISQVGNAVLDATKLIFHPSYNYFAFTFSVRNPTSPLFSLLSSLFLFLFSLFFLLFSHHSTLLILSRCLTSLLSLASF
jgi:hypothetical protein